MYCFHCIIFALLDLSMRSLVLRSLPIFGSLQDCIGTPGQYPSEETLSRIPISFWHILLDELARVEPTTRMAKLTLQLQPVYEQLVKLLLRKCELPDPATLDVDEKEDLRCYRQDIADCYVSGEEHDIFTNPYFQYKNGAIQFI